MEEVTMADANAFATYINEQNLSPNRYNKIIQTCRLVFNTLQEGELNGHPNPFGETSKKGISNKSQKRSIKGRRDLSEAELAHICGTATGELRTLFAIGIYTGLRMGDVATLRWEEVKLSTGQIIRKTNKTNDLLCLPINPSLRPILEEISFEKRHKYVLPQFVDLYLKDRTQLSKIIQKHFKLCGIQTTRTREFKHATCEVGFHSLRHTFITICAKKGVSMATLGELCGHRSVTVQSAYMHLGKPEYIEAVNAIPSVTDVSSSPEIKGNANEGPINLPPKSGKETVDKPDPINTAIALLHSMTVENFQTRRNEVIHILKSTN